MGLSQSTRLLGDGAEELLHLPALQQGGNLRQAEWALSVWCQQHLPQPDTAHIPPEAVHHSPQLQQNCLDEKQFSVPKVHRKAHGTPGSKGNLPLIRGERSCWRLSEGVVRPWAMLAEAAVLSLLVCVCCCHVPDSVHTFAEQLHSTSATADGSASAFKAARHLQKWLTGKWRKSHLLSILRVQSLKGFSKSFRDLELNKAAVKFFLLLSQEWRGHCCDPHALTAGIERYRDLFSMMKSLFFSISCYQHTADEASHPEI